MSSSVSSERAFSQGGITISKHRNCLKGDIVEALQCVKSAIRNDLLFRESGPSSLAEVEEMAEIELGDMNAGEGHEEESDIEGPSWDELLIEDEDDDAMSE
jgi:hypothetical protein